MPAVNMTPWMDVSLKYKGIHEIDGDENNPNIMRFYIEAGMPQDSEEVPWCSAAMNAFFYECGLTQFMTHNLMAKSWLSAPNMEKIKLKDIRYGDIVIFNRGGPSSGLGHVTNFVRWADDGSSIICRGGNQHDSINESRFGTDNIAGIRRPIYHPVDGYKVPEPEDKMPPLVTATAIVPQPPSKTPSATEMAAGGAGVLAAMQSHTWWIAAGIILVAAVVIGYLWWRSRYAKKT